MYRSHLTCAKLKNSSGYTFHPWYIFMPCYGTFLFHKAFSAVFLIVRRARTRYGPNIKHYSSICCQNWGTSRNVDVHSTGKFEIFALLWWVCGELKQADSGAVCCRPFRCGKLQNWIFKLVRKIFRKKNDYYLRRVCTSVCSFAWDNLGPTTDFHEI